MPDFNLYLQQFIGMSVNYAPKILLAVLLLVIGWWVISRITNMALHAIDRSKINSPELKSFFGSLLSVGMKVLLLISVAGVVGIETTSFVGIIAAMGFAIGLALQGNLSNFAAGVLILMFRPFKVGDEVKIKGVWSFVKEIQMFHTVLKKFDNTEMIMPNSSVISEGIHNLSVSPTRGIAVLLRIPFSENLDRVLKIAKDAAYSIPEVDQTGEPFFWITDTEPQFIQVYANFVVPQTGFWTTDFKVRKAIIEAFQKNQIRVVYPGMANFGEYGVVEPALERASK